MKPFAVITIALFTIVSTCTSQADRSQEFNIYSNGLIYSPGDMKALRQIVDSLNLRFKSCDLNIPCISYPQGRVWKVKFDSEINDLTQIIKDLEAGKDFSFIIEKYKSFITSKDTSQLLVKIAGSGDDETYFLCGSPLNGYGDVYGIKENDFSDNGQWTFEHSKKGEIFSTNSLNCWYLPAPLSRKPVPAAFARLVQYVDCMIDTNTTVMLGKFNYKDRYKSPDCIQPIYEYLNQKMNVKRNDSTDMQDYLTDEKIEFAKTHLANDADFIRLVKEGTEACIQQNTGSADMESLAGIFISKNKQLELMRYRRVIGACSMDRSPRLHALSIAVLAAETQSWDIFLRAHMDIMNDRFERMSDGSYAYGNRKTYLKELEELGLNVVDLMIGLTLRVENRAHNHYYGTIWRLGWALTESADRKLFEERVLVMLQNLHLDEFNRGLLFVLYRSYLNHLDDKKEQLEKVKSLKAISSRFPADIREAVAKMKMK